MQDKFSPVLIIVAGPTAVGKSEVAVQLAAEFSTGVINSDSRQVYREMVIGTAMPGDDLRSKVPHFLFGHRSIHDEYNASLFEYESVSFLEDWFQKHHCMIMTGGSGLYVDAVYNGIDDLPSVDPEIRSKLQEEYRNKGHDFILDRLRIIDPVYFETVDRQNARRILKALEIYEMTGRSYSSFLKKEPKKRMFRIKMIGLDRPRVELHNRINQRTDEMIASGLVDEAMSLMNYRHLNALNTVGYKELFGYFDGKYSLSDAVDMIKAHTRQYARRQLTWFRRYPDIQWFHPDNLELILNFCQQTTD